MDADQRRLAALVGPIDDFAGQHWGRRPMFRSSGEDLTRLLNVSEVERLLLGGARRPTFRLVSDGITLPAERSTAPVRLGGARLDDVADLARISDAVGGGATLVLQGLQRTSPALVDLCRSLERATSHPVQANAYLTPAGAAGLARHGDTHDVLVLQVNGSKAWKVDGFGAVTSSPGDVLYLPANTPHSAEAQGAWSLHITIGIVRVTVRQVVRRALDNAGLVDSALPLGYARAERGDDLVQTVADRLREAAVALSRVDAEAIAADERERARTRRRPLATGLLGSMLELDAIGPETIVTSRPHHVARLDEDPDRNARVVVRLPDRRLLLPPAMRPAVERLLVGDDIAVGELPGLDPGSRVVLVKRLVREGLLVVVAR